MHPAEFSTYFDAAVSRSGRRRVPEVARGLSTALMSVRVVIGKELLAVCSNPDVAASAPWMRAWRDLHRAWCGDGELIGTGGDARGQYKDRRDHARRRALLAAGGHQRGRCAEPAKRRLRRGRRE